MTRHICMACRKSLDALFRSAKEKLRHRELFYVSRAGIVVCNAASGCQ